MTALLLVLGLAVGCGAPSADTTRTVAGAAALAAGAATVADPDGAAKRQENKGNGGQPTGKPKKVKETVPPDVLDRLDDAEENKSPVDAGAPTDGVPPSDRR